MQWLLHGSTTSGLAEALATREHTVHPMSELNLPADAAPSEILAAAEARQWDIVTTDKDLATAPYERKQPFGRTIVHLQLQGGDAEQKDAIGRLFDRYRRLSPRRLYTVTATRVKIRQLPAPGGVPTEPA